jgi:hypothetical protein
VTVYAPGTLETDPKKQNMALQQQASAISSVTTDTATNTTNIATNTANIATNTTNIANLTSGIAGHISGLTLSTAGSSSTFSVAAGVAADSTGASFMALGSSISKTTGSWAVGSGNGALDTGTIANNTWYHVYEIKRTDTNVVDVVLSTSASSPTMPTDYTLSRRIGSMKTDGSAHWVKFFQLGDAFYWDVPVQDVSATNPGTSAVTRTLTTPLGVKTTAILNMVWSAPAASSSRMLLTSLDIADTAASSSAFNLWAPVGSTGSASNVFVTTNTSSQIRSRTDASDAGATLLIVTSGWVDSRGR